MAIQIHKQPQSLTPCYNQMIIAVTSSNQSLTNFQFIGDIYANGILLTRLKVPVSPDGYGVFDVHRHIENQITYDFDPEMNGWNVATNSFATYSVEFSEEFRSNWPFYDNFFSSGNVGFIGATSIAGGGAEPLFEVGDEIFIQQTDLVPTNPEYNGLSTITQVGTNSNAGIFGGNTYWYIVTNKPFLDSSPAEGGTVSLANFGLKILSVTASTGERSAWNGVYDFDGFITYDEDTLIANTSGPAQWMTNMPDNWNVCTASRVKFLTFRDDYNSQTSLKVQSNNGIFTLTGDSYTYGPQVDINSYTNNGGLVRFNCNSAHGLTTGDTFQVWQSPYNGVYTVASVQTSTQVTGNLAYTTGGAYGAEYLKKVTGGLLQENLGRMVGVGPYELMTYTSSFTTGTSSFPIIDSTTATYSVWTVDSSGDIDVAPKVFTIKDCCSRYEKIQLLFLDKKGSFVPYTFNKVNREMRDIQKSNYQQKYGQYAPASNNWSYDTYSRGTKSLDTVVTVKYTVHSDWVDQSTSDYLMELFESPEVYWVKEDGTTFAITLTDTSVERKQTINDQIINYVVNFELSMKSMKQKG